VERVSDVLIVDDGAAPNCFAVNNTFRLTYNVTLTNPTTISAATTSNFDVYDSAGSAGLVILASSTVGLAPGGTPQTVITVVVQQAGTAGNINTTATGSGFRLKNLRIDSTSLAVAANATVTSSVASSNAGTTVNGGTVATLNVGTALKTVTGVTLTAGTGNQSSGTTVANASFVFSENFNNAFRVAGTACTTGAGCDSGVSKDIQTNATSFILDAGTSIPSGVTVTFPSSISTSAQTTPAGKGVIYTSRTGQVTCTGSNPCSVIYDTTGNDKTGAFSLTVGSGTAVGVPTLAANPSIGIAIATASGSGTATLHGSFGPGLAAGTGADDVNASAVPRYVAANTSASTITRNIFSGTWFTIAPVSTTLMYSYVTTVSGFLTGIQVANTGLDTGVPFTTAGAAGNAGAQTGGIKFWFFGQDPSNSNAPVVFALNTDSNVAGGLGPSAGRGLDAQGRLAPGGVFAAAVVGGSGNVGGLLAAARNAGLTTATQFEGYVIAVTSFTYAHGNGVVFQGANAFAYAAHVMSGTTRSITAPAGFGENFNN